MKNDDEYEKFLDDIILDFKTQAIANAPVSLTEVVKLLILDNDNTRVQKTCAELKIATKREFAAEVNRARQRAVLGIAPANATQLVEAFVETFKIVAHYDGTFTREVQPTMKTDKGEIIYITKADRDDAMIDLYAAFHHDMRAKMNRLDIERELRTLATNYRMNINRFDITDAVEEWVREAQRARLHDIFVEISNGEPCDDRWIEFAEAVFDCSDTSPEYVAAVLRKFMWQVKRKIRGIPVYDHLMPVILGPQGIGKSTLVNHILAPVVELKLNVDFQMITDERNVQIWASFVLFLDEMGYASKADIDTVKNVITAPTLTRRPMQTNSQITIAQNATLIGCSNKELSQLVRDPTGNRRFVGIRMRSDVDREFVNAIDWTAMWGSVDVSAADPMSEYRDLLSEQQDETRERGRVEQWMIDFDGCSNIYHSAMNKVGNLNGKSLYLVFREYEDEYYPGHYKMSKTDWDYEMTRIAKNAPESMMFDKTRGTAGIMYRWKKQAGPGADLKLVD